MYHEKYDNAEVVIVAELIKMIVSGIFTYNEDTSPSDTFIKRMRKMGSVFLNGKRMIVLVVLYSISNMLQYFCISKIGPAVFSVLMQLKILSTAIFATYIAGVHYSFTKWRALVLLVIGCILVASPLFSKSPEDAKSPAATIDEQSDMSQAVQGICGVFFMVVISGFSSVYLEGMMKGKEGAYEPTIWERNFQLSSYSLIFLVVATMAQNWRLTYSTVNDTSSSTSASELPYVAFRGWSLLTVLISMLSASGGILVASTLKYADSVSKCFASAMSIIITTLVAYFALGTVQMNIGSVLGMCTSVIAVFNYALDVSSPPHSGTGPGPFPSSSSAASAASATPEDESEVDEKRVASVKNSEV